MLWLCAFYSRMFLLLLFIVHVFRARGVSHVMRTRNRGDSVFGLFIHSQRRDCGRACCDVCVMCMCAVYVCVCLYLNATLYPPLYTGGLVSICLPRLIMFYKNKKLINNFYCTYNKLTSVEHCIYNVC